MLIAVGGVKGSPGATSVALALAARWPQPARTLLVEADPAGGDLAIRFDLAMTPSLVSLAADARRSDRADPAQQLWRHAQPLPVGVSVVAAPPDAHQARAAIAALGNDDAGVLRSAADGPGVVVVVDCGRVDPGSAATRLLRGADAMVVLARPRADELAHLVRRLPEFAQWARHTVLVVTGPGHASAEVARELGVAVLARLPHDTAGAQVLSGEGGWSLPLRRRRLDRSALGRAAGQLAADLIDLTAPDAATTGTPSRATPATAGPVTRSGRPVMAEVAQPTGTGRWGSAPC